jgi:hypothetical protein
MKLIVGGLLVVYIYFVVFTPIGSHGSFLVELNVPLFVKPFGNFWSLVVSAWVLRKLWPREFLVLLLVPPK